MGYLAGALHLHPTARRTTRRGRYAGRVHLRYHRGDYYMAGGFFSHLFHQVASSIPIAKVATGLLAPVLSAPMRKVNAMLEPFARQAGFGKVADVMGALGDAAQSAEGAPHDEQGRDEMQASQGGASMAIDQPSDMNSMPPATSSRQNLAAMEADEGEEEEDVEELEDEDEG